MPDSQLLHTFNYIKANFSAQVFKGEMRNDKYSLNQKNTGRPYCNIVIDSSKILTKYSTTCLMNEKHLARKKVIQIEHAPLLPRIVTFSHIRTIVKYADLKILY